MSDEEDDAADDAAEPAEAQAPPDQAPRTFSYAEAAGQEPGRQAPKTFSYEEATEPETSAFGAGLREFARNVVPSIAGAVGGVASAALASPTAVPTAGIGPIVAGFAGGAAAAGGMRYIQDKILNALDLDSPESQARDVGEHPYASTAGALATAPLTFGSGIGSTIAQRGGSAAVLGGANAAQQLYEKGSIDPTELAMNAAAGAALGRPRSLIEGSANELATAARGGGWRPQSSWRPSTGPVDETVSAAASELGNRAEGNTAQTAEPPPGGAAGPAEGPPAEPSANAGFEIPKGGVDIGGVEPVEPMGPAGPPQERNPNVPEPVTPVPPEPRGDFEIPKGLDLGLGSPAEPIGEPTRARVTAGEQKPPEEPNIPAQEPAREPTPGEQAAATSRERSVTGTLADQGYIKRGALWIAPKDQTPEERAAVAARSEPAANKEAPGSEGQTVEPPKVFSYEEATAPATTPAEDQAIADLAKEKAVPHPLSGDVAAGTADFAPATKEAQVKNTSIWRTVNDSLDKLFRLPQWVFAPHTISDKGEFADKIIRANMGFTSREMVQHQAALADQQAYFDNMTPAQRTHAVTEYENGQLPADHPGSAYVAQAGKVAAQLDSELHATPNAMKNYTNGITQFFPEANRQQVKDFITDFKEKNDRYPSLGEIMKQGKLKLSDDLLMADGSPDPQKVINQQNVAKSLSIRQAKVIEQGRNGQELGPGIPHIDPIIHDAPGEGLVMIPDRFTGGMKLYAAPEVSAVLDRYFDPSVRDPKIRNAYEAYMRIKSADVAWNLLGAIYHFRFMGLEAPINEIATGMARLHVNPKEGLKDIAKSIASPYTLFKAGKNDVMDALLYPDKVKDPLTRVVNDITTEAGMLPPFRVRGMGTTPELETGVMKGIVTGWKPAWQQFMRDTVQEGMKLKNRAANLKNSTSDSALSIGKDAGIYALKTIGEALQAVMHPLFNWYIPLLKAGAVHTNMKRFMIDNPGLSHDDYVNTARKFVNAVDNAMGEMNQSTIYAPGFVKALGNATMISPSWNVGDVKQFLGGTRAFIRNPKAALTGKDYDPRIMYIPAFVVATAMYNIAAQILHGQGGPKDLTDVAFPRTGGTTKKGNPERLIQPGYEKDVAEAANILGGPDPMGKSFTHMMYNKLAPFPRTLMDEFIYNQNFAGKQIANPNDPFVTRLGQYAQYFVKNTLTPIMLQQLTQEEKNPGTHISRAEKVFGNRHAPEQWQDSVAYLNRHREEARKAAEAAKKFHERTGY